MEVVLVYQRAGASKSGRAEGWKTLHASDIEAVRLLGTRFLRVREDADPDARELGTVHCFAG
ncbi:MAG TPA: hypothetical protein VNA57_04405 [Acidimicrobiales bacterium]|nr:hypothetical protein [Acidimicrobiales bacterium]